MNEQNPWGRSSLWMAALGWGSVLILSWLVVTRSVPVDPLTGLMWIFFLTWGIVATAFLTTRRDEEAD